ncbi:MAG: xylulokinase [Sphaerochaetaceae bacterium]|nr:xylulokinase [Sphaerochaetaceae bacterium]
MYFIGIDCGTQGSKTVILDSTTNKIIGKGYSKHNIIIEKDGVREQFAQWWIDAIEKSIFQAIDSANINPKLIKAIGVSGQQHGLVPLDNEGNVIRKVKLWNDTSTSVENESIINTLGGMDEVWNTIGGTLPIGYTASKVKYLIDNEPELYAKTKYVLLPHDYINYYLTNIISTDPSEASGTGYYDVRTHKYSDKMLNVIDPTGALKSKLPKVYNWETPIGYIRPEIAKKFGFSKDLIVSAGGGDNTMGAIGTGSIIPGFCTISLGTSGTCCFASKKKNDHIHKLIQIYDLLNDKYLCTSCILGATSSTTKIQELFSLSLNEFDTLMNKASIGAEGLLSLPFYDGERIPPIPAGQGIIKNISASNLTKENIIRSTAESIIFILKNGYNHMIKSFEEPSEFIVTGGGSNSEPWRQILADIFNKKINCLKENEGGALGAAIQANYLYNFSKNKDTSLIEIIKSNINYDTSKVKVPIKENVKLYREYFRLFKDSIKNEWGVDV